jgi:hypothetical protein
LKHVLIDCVDVADVRQTLYNVNNLYDLFTNVAADTILKFLKDINVYTKNIYRLIHALFHIRTVIIPRDRYRKKTCINLFITYFNSELKRTKLTSHTKLIWIWVIDMSWGMITFLIWKKSCIDIFIERLDIVLSDFCSDICPYADIAVALPVFTYGQNWRYYLWICDKVDVRHQPINQMHFSIVNFSLIWSKGRQGRDPMVVGFITTRVISAYNH